MKTSFFHSAVLAIIACSLLSSCAILQKNEFAQRKYYDFPRSKYSVTEKETKYVSMNIQDKTIPQNTVTQERKQASEPVASVSAAQKEIILPQADVIIPNTQKEKNSIRENVSNKKPVISYKKSDIIKFLRQTSRHSSAFSDAGTTFFIMVLAAIFIPPLGVYMKDRPRITTWFWVTLVLCVLASGAMVMTTNSLTGGGLWFVASLIALLVVFDII